LHKRRDCVLGGLTQAQIKASIPRLRLGELQLERERWHRAFADSVNFVLCQVRQRHVPRSVLHEAVSMDYWVAQTREIAEKRLML
jgi:hypothetical protein